MPRLDIKHRLPAFASFLALGALATLFVSLASPSDPKNSILFGYSLERILLGGGLFLLSLALLFLTWNLIRQPEASTRLWRTLTARGNPGDWLFFLFIFLFFCCWALLFLPPYHLGRFAGYAQRLTPLIVWLAVVGGVGSGVFVMERKTDSRQTAIETGAILRFAFFVFMATILLGSFSLATGIGFRYPEDYWYGAGVPALGLQVVFSLLAGAGFYFIEKKIGERKYLDAILFLLLWLVSAWLWGQAPLSPNYFMPDTADNIIYPYSDGATFDTAAQYALIGQGLQNGLYFDRALYGALLAYLHFFLGQDYSVLMTAQAALLAALPAVVYLIGREMRNRALGLAAGIMIALRGLNAVVVAKYIDTASPKMALTDFPTALGVALFLLFLLKWLKKPARVSRLLWAGAVFGLTLMVRAHVLLLLPAALLFIPFQVRMNWRKFLLVGLVLVLGLVSVTLPWEVRNQSRGIPMYYVYYSRIEILLKYRYGVGADAFVPPSQPALTASHALTHQRVAQADEPWCDSKLCVVANHFVHNLITSVVSLPSSFVMDDLFNTVKSDLPYWQKDWNAGRIGLTGGTLLLANLALIALGAGVLWKQSRWIALLPLLFVLVYLLTNSIGLTSGGRYLAPVDWIVYLYYIAGGLQVVLWLLALAGFVRDEEPATWTAVFELPGRETYIRLLPVVLLMMGVGALIPFSEAVAQPRYALRSAEDMLVELEERGLLEQSGFTREELSAFLSQPGAMIREGRALYPRYYPGGEGEQDRSTYYRYLDYPRLVLTLIGPYSSGAEGVVIPGLAPPYSFHAGDVVTLGCWNTTYYAPFIDAALVFYTGGDGFVYTRSPGSPLQCPLQTP
jgi:hypothetical protein